MKFKIRHADEIVGFFSIAALVGLVALIFALGAEHNWFLRKNIYYTEFESGSNISIGMNIQYKGFSIGQVKSIKLEDNIVKVEFYVLEQYTSYVKRGSLVEVIVNPIGLGSQFAFYPGNGKELIPSGSQIYRVDSTTGQLYLDEGLNGFTRQSDSIGSLIANVTDVINNLKRTINDVNNAFEGKGTAPLTQTLANVNQITANLNQLTNSISDPTGLVPKVLGPGMTSKLDGILMNVDKITKQLDSLSKNANQLVGQSTPQIDAALTQLNEALLQVQDVLTGLKNNPLIRSGIPDRSQGGAATSQSRNTDF